MSHQKLCLAAAQRDELICQKYTLDVSVYTPDMFVFLDETGADRQNVRKYGYSLHGIPLKHNTFLVRGERVSGLAFMSVHGLLDISVIKGTTDGDTFYNFVQKHLFLQLLLFDGVNRHSVSDYG